MRSVVPLHKCCELVEKSFINGQTDKLGRKNNAVFKEKLICCTLTFNAEDKLKRQLI